MNLFELKYKAFLFFSENTNLENGLTKDRANNFGFDDYSVASIASTGYALASLPISVANGWMTFDEALLRANRTLIFFQQKVLHINGWFYHFVDFNTGNRVWNCEVSSIDTGLLIMGAICCREFFKNRTIQQLVDELYDRIDWQWMLTNGGEEPKKLFLSHGWTPEKGFIKNNWDTYCEHMFLYILGMGARLNPLSQENWNAWNRPIIKYKKWSTLVGGPIFIHQMSHGWFDFKGWLDSKNIDYWKVSYQATYINRQFCVDNIPNRRTYKENIWGINACDYPNGYKAFAAPGDEDGTISPSGAIASIIFTPNLSRAAANCMYNKYSKNIWGRYGFVNAFNIDQNWFDNDVIGIDLGMMLLNLENAKSKMIWQLLSTNSYLKEGWRKAGFKKMLQKV